MKVLVTGSTGFVGGNLVRALKAKGYEIRVLVRKQSDDFTLRHIDVERVTGDLTDRESLERALKDCEGLFHCAALYTFWNLDYREVYRVNVEGTKTILQEAIKAGVKKVVYTSSVATIGIPQKGLGTEDTEPTPANLIGHYKRSKYEAEQEAMKAVSMGLPVVVVNPTAPVGPWDVKPTPTGGIILDFLKGKIPAYVNTGLNIVDVEDVATGHILAMEKGQPGQRYILGNRNMTFKNLLDILSNITGKKGPYFRIPITVLIALGMIDELIEGKLLKKKPQIPLEGIRIARRPMYVTSRKAIQELGFPQNSPEVALENAVKWFRNNDRV